MVSVRWTGAAGLEFTYDGKTWLIDPYLSRVGKATVFFGRPQADREKISRYLETLPGKLQAVIVGHTHFDHARFAELFWFKYKASGQVNLPDQ